MRGSSDILASVECHIALDRKGRDKSITVIQAKNRIAEEMKPFTINIVADDNHFVFEHSEEIDEKKIKTEEEESLFVEVLKDIGQATILEIHHAMKGEMGTNKIRRIAAKLKVEDRIDSKVEAHNREVFFLKESTVQVEL